MSLLLPHNLTAREVEVLRTLSLGCTYAQVAAHLGITAHTVSLHTTNAYRKLGVHTAAGAVFRAVQLGLF